MAIRNREHDNIRRPAALVILVLFAVLVVLVVVVISLELGLLVYALRSTEFVVLVTLLEQRLLIIQLETSSNICAISSPSAIWWPMQYLANASC